MTDPHDGPPEIWSEDSRIVFRSRWMTLREDRIVRKDGGRGQYAVVEKPDFTVVAAVEQGRIRLVEQFRYPVGARYWELPQGTKEDGSALSAEDLARAELREETGLSARELHCAGELFLAYGMCTQRYLVWLASGLSQGAQDLDPEEAGLVSRWFELRQFEQMLISGTIRDGVTMAAFGLLRLKGML